MRDHEPINITEFNGLWKRGDEESCPLDHFTDCLNIKYIQSGFATRDGVEVYTFGGDDLTLPEVVRIYVYVHGDQESLLALDTLGNIFHTGSPTPGNPILSIPAMTDFAFVNVAGRAYISPSNGITGLEGEFLYVYLGDGNPARKAAGPGPTSSVTVTLVPPGHIELGIHLVNVVYETDTGFLTEFDPELSEFLHGVGTHAAEISNVPISPNAYVVARHIVVTKTINPSFFTGNKAGYTYYFVPNGRIPNNSGTVITIDFFDADLLEDASHLIDNFTEIPAFVQLNTYHDRLVGVGEYGDPTDDEDFIKVSTARLSAKGEPEAISEVDGLIVAPLDGTGLTNAQEYRDVLYLFKNTRTYSYNDNGDVPSSWPGITIDQGYGCSVHGIAAVLDSGGVNVEFLLITNYAGLVMFNGSFVRPELTWKIEDLWRSYVPQDNDQAREDFIRVQIMNDSLAKRLYITLPDYTMLYAEYSDGLDPKNIKWAPWSFPTFVTTIALININELVIGARVVLP